MDAAKMTPQDEADQIISWLYEGSLTDSIKGLLEKGNQARKDGNWEEAKEHCWQAFDQANAPGVLRGSADSTKGVVRVYLGEICHAQGDFRAAVDHLRLAQKEFSSDRHNQVVTKFALGVSYARRGQRDKVYEYVSANVLNAMRAMGVKEVEPVWKSVLKLLDEQSFSQEGSKVATPQPKREWPSDSPQMDREPLRTIPMTSGKTDLGVSLGGGLVIIAILLMIVIGCGALVYAFGKKMGLVAYILSLLVSTIVLYYLFRKRLQTLIPPQHAALIEELGKPKVKYGPQTYTRAPLIEKMRALVPLYRLKYTTPKLKVLTGSGETIEVRIMVSYGIELSRETNAEQRDKANIANIEKAVYRAQPPAKTQKKRQNDKRKQRATISTDDLRQTWEKVLLSDIQVTLNEVFSGITYEQLSYEKKNRWVELDRWLRTQLTTRTQDWGVQIEEVSIMELGKPHD